MIYVNHFSGDGCSSPEIGSDLEIEDDTGVYRPQEKVISVCSYDFYNYYQYVLLRSNCHDPIHCFHNIKTAYYKLNTAHP